MKIRFLMCGIVGAVFTFLFNPSRLGAQGAKKDHPQYRLIDIGTFGGPASFINPSGNGGPYISQDDTTVGTAATPISSNPANHGFFCSGLDGSLSFVFHAFELRNGNVTDLGALPPSIDNCSDALAVNALGEIVGGSENGLIEPVMGFTQVRAVRWKDGEIKDLGTLGGNLSQATAINNRSQIVGYALNAIPDSISMAYTLFGGPSVGTQTRAFLWEDGQMEDLGTLGGPDAFALFVNERGQIAGFSYTNSEFNSVTHLPTIDPFLWEDGRMLDLGTLGGTFSSVNALNNRGQVIGQSNLAGDQDSHPFLWDGEKLIDLNTRTTNGNPVTADAINDAGEIVGGSAFPGRVFDAYVWKDGVAMDLGTLPGDCFSEAFAINSSGQIVGQSVACDFSTRSFLWDNGSMIDLGAVVSPNPSSQLVETIAISDRGEIAGDLVPPTCTGIPQGNDTQCGHAYVLIPAHEDGSEEMEAVSRTQSASVSQNSTTAIPDRAAAQEMMARIRNRLRAEGPLPRRVPKAVTAAAE